MNLRLHCPHCKNRVEPADFNERQQVTCAACGSSFRLDDISTADLPSHLGSYRVLGEIARGGMGRIVRIHDEAFDRPLAMKVLLERGDDRLAERFLREAKLTGQLQHPGIPPVQEMGKLEDGRPYFIMKLIEGQSLADMLWSPGSRVNESREMS